MSPQETIYRVASFSQGQEGGNPAGVMLLDEALTADRMLEIAAEVGFSETVFAVRTSDPRTWQVRYFAPKIEVPFCGHATVALGAVLAREVGPGTYDLSLNDGQISVSAQQEDFLYSATLHSPPTSHKALPKADRKALLELFDYAENDLNADIPAALIHGGAQHVVLPLKSRASLARMAYDFEAGQTLMNAMGLVTVLFAWQENTQTFHVRNAFAAGGVVEDPATGAAAAAFAGYLRDAGLSPVSKMTLYQGQDMGVPSILNVNSAGGMGGPVSISGTVPWLD